MNSELFNRVNLLKQRNGFSSREDLSRWLNLGESFLQRLVLGYLDIERTNAISEIIFSIPIETNHLRENEYDLSFLMLQKGRKRRSDELRKTTTGRRYKKLELMRPEPLQMKKCTVCKITCKPQYKTTNGFQCCFQCHLKEVDYLMKMLNKIMEVVE